MTGDLYELSHVIYKMKKRKHFQCKVRLKEKKTKRSFSRPAGQGLLTSSKPSVLTKTRLTDADIKIMIIRLSHLYISLIFSTYGPAHRCNALIPTKLWWFIFTCQRERRVSQRRIVTMCLTGVNAVNSGLVTTDGSRSTLHWVVNTISPRP